MNTVIFVVGAMWLLPILAILISNLILSETQRREIAALAGDRAVTDKVAARAIVGATKRVHHAVASVGAGTQDSGEERRVYHLSLN